MKNIFSFIVLFFGFYLSVNAQDNTIDSLKKAFNKTQVDTLKTKILLDVSTEFSYFNIDSSLYYAQRAKEFALKSKDKKWIVAAFNETGWQHFMRGESDKANENYNTALKINIDENNRYETARSYARIGMVFAETGDYSQALEFYEKSLVIATEIDNQLLVAKNLNNIGTVYMNRSDYPRALSYFFKTLRITEEMNEKNGISILYGNIANIYNFQGDYVKALDFYEKALKLKKEIGDKEGISIQYGNIGIVFKDMAGKPQYTSFQKDSLLNLALEYYFKALKTNEEIGYKNGMGMNLGNIALVYDNLSFRANDKTKGRELFLKAVDYYSKALKLAEETSNVYGIARQTGNMGVMYAKRNDYKNGEIYLSKALKVCDSLKAFEYIKEFEKQFYEMDTARKNYAGAFEHYKKYIAARDSLSNEENTKKQTQMEMQYDFDKKEAESKAEQDKKDAITQAEKTKQQIVIILVSFVLLLVVFFAIVVSRSLRVTKQQKIVIEKQKEQVERQKLLVEEKQKEIIDSINYARRIQQSILPSEKYIAKYLKVKKFEN
jgi:tetratricopeptide (TPR) repeat protein